MTDRDEFYIGYEPEWPSRTRTIVVRAVCAAAAVAVLVAAGFVWQQRPLARSRFEFGHTRTFDGYLARHPAPALWIPGRGPHWLVAPGKFGAAAMPGMLDDGWVTVSGSLIEREHWRMIEVPPGGIRRTHSDADAPLPADARGARVTLTGEIVDSKCYLGVMNPGERTVHRDCAVRCLSGGIPAMFAYRDSAGTHLALLLGGDESLRRDYVGRPVTLSGNLSGSEEALVLTVEPND